jgi:hypothetical protein
MTITEHDAGLRAFPVVERRTLAKDDTQSSASMQNSRLLSRTSSHEHTHRPRGLTDT